MDIEFAFVVQGEDVYSPLELAMTLQTDEESLIEDALADLLIEQGKIDRAGLERAQRVCVQLQPSAPAESSGSLHRVLWYFRPAQMLQSYPRAVDKTGQQPLS